MIYAKNGTAITVAFGPVLNADGTVYTSTLAYTDFRIWKNGTAGALNASATATHDNQGVFALALTTSDISAVGNISVALNKATLAAPTAYLIVVAANWFDSMQGNANVNANTVAINGTTQTARDIGANVLISPGTGTGQLDVTSGVIKANLAQILGTALTETAGQIAAAFKQFFNIASPTSTMNTITTVTTATNLTNAPTNGDFTSTQKTSLNAATPASVTGAVGSVTGNVGGNVVGSVGSVTGAVGSVTAVVSANLTQILGTALTETSGYLAAGFKKFFNVASPTHTVASVDQTGDGYSYLTTNLGGLGANATALATAVWAVATRTLSAFGFTVATNSDTNVTAIKAKTDNLPASPAAVGSAMTLTVAYDAAKTAAQAGNQMDLVNAPNSTALTAIATAVWAAGTRTLTSLGTVVSDTASAVWAAVTRTLTSGSAPSAATVASAVWEESLSGHTTAGTAGKTLSQAGSGGVDNAALAAAILAEPIGTPAASTIGQAIAEGALNAGTGQYLRVPVSLRDNKGGPVEGALIYVTADAAGAGTRIRDGLYTDSSGNIPGYWLNPGAYYWHATKAGWIFPAQGFSVP